MFFLIPIGSEEGVRRLPYLTIALITINVIIWIITTSILGGQITELEKLEEQLFKIEKKYFYKVLERDPNLLTTFDYEEVRKLFSTGDIIPLESDDFRQWKNLYQQYNEKRSSIVFEQFGFKPKNFDILKLFSSMFIHANIIHLFFNMLFLWLVGCNIEDDWSWKVFLGLYIISGIVASLLHAAVFPKSNMPLIGASGAIAGIMGAFMIRHFKTKIRFAYFIWFLIHRPLFGTVAIYAGIVLPFWFLQQIFGASLGFEAGTAYWAHIGGFVFGAGVGTSLKFLGLEKKYIAPMVEDSFEKLKVSPKMKEVYRKLDVNNIGGALPLLLTVIAEEPQNFDACLILARIYFGKGQIDDALTMYNKAISIVLRGKDTELVISIYEEIQDKNILNKLSDKTIYNLASFLEKIDKDEDAVKLFGLYVNLFPISDVRPKVIFRLHTLFKDKLHNGVMSQSALAFLKKEYPDFPLS